VTPDERQRALEAIAADVRACTACRLHETRTLAVPGEGSAETEVVFVGEGPGFNEDRQGRPFVGAAGSFLTELLGTVGWTRSDVFITNVVKCRPPENRDPEPDEMAACVGHLRRQLAVIEPALVVTLGRHSLGSFLPGARIGQVHGTARPAATDLLPPESTVFAMYHPAAALHQGSLRQTLITDMGAVPAALLAARERAAAAPDGPASAGSRAVAEPAFAAGTPDPLAAAADATAVAPSPASGADLEPSADQLTLFA
jgi:uracil-DNA glycosylase family 4